MTLVPPLLYNNACILYLYKIHVLDILNSKSNELVYYNKLVRLF